MPVYVKETLLAASPQAVWDFHMAPDALEKLTPPGAGVEIVKPALVENGSVVELRIQAGPLPIKLKWLSRHEQVEPPHKFVDVAIQSPFAQWEHHHLFLDRDGKCLMRDEVRYRAPLGPLGAIFGEPIIRHILNGQFNHRHKLLLATFGAG